MSCHKELIEYYKSLINPVKDEAERIETLLRDDEYLFTLISQGNNNDELLRILLYKSEYGSSDFSVGEFKGRYNLHTLCEAIRKGGLSIRSDNISELNQLLQQSDLYEQLVKIKTNLNLSEDLKKVKDAYDNSKTKDDLKKLNRLLLEAVYPQKTPKRDKSTYAKKTLQKFERSVKEARPDIEEIYEKYASQFHEISVNILLACEKIKSQGHPCRNKDIIRVIPTIIRRNRMRENFRKKNEFIEEDICNLQAVIEKINEDEYCMMEYFKKGDLDILNTTGVTREDKIELIISVLNKSVLSDVKFHEDQETAITNADEVHNILRYETINAIKICKDKNINGEYRLLKQKEKSLIRRRNMEIICDLFPQEIVIYRPLEVSLEEHTTSNMHRLGGYGKEPFKEELSETTESFEEDGEETEEEREESGVSEHEPIGSIDMPEENVEIGSTVPTEEIDSKEELEGLMKCFKYIISLYSEKRSLYWFIKECICCDEDKIKFSRLAKTQRKSFLDWISKNSKIIFSAIKCKGYNKGKLFETDVLVNGIILALINIGGDEDIIGMLSKEQEIFNETFKKLLSGYGSEREIRRFINDCDSKSNLSNTGSQQKRRFRDYLYDNYTILSGQHNNLSRYEDIICSPEKGVRTDLMDKVEIALRNKEIVISHSGKHKNHYSKRIVGRKQKK